MESMPVNWEALDSLVIEFVKSENLVEEFQNSPPSPPPSPSSSSYRSRLLIRQIRKSLEIGDVDFAINLLRIHAPSVLEDHRLLFRLQKQKFIELLRKGTSRDRDCAIECLRTALAPCALNAYPEAYEEFKHVLLAFIFDKEDETSPVANEWSERRRFDIAGLLCSVLRAHLQAYDPVFSMTLRYLISIHKVFCFRQGITSPISDLTERLLLEERDHPATPQESLYEAPPFDEVDIQALAHAVELTRQGAVDSLRFSKGDLFQAFQNELCRMKLDLAMLDELVHEYCIYRGIVDGALVSPSASDVHTPSRSSKIGQPDLGYSSSRDCSCLNVSCGTGRHSDGETSVNNVDTDGPREVNTDSTNIQGTDVELRLSYEVTSNREDCSTSEIHEPKNCCRRLQRSRSHASGQRNRRKRWKGRVETERLQVDRDVSFIERNKSLLFPLSMDTSDTSLEEEQVSIKRSALENVDSGEDHKFEIVLEMRELARNGMAAEVVEELNAIDPNFFVQNPFLLFQLKQVEFLKLVNCGDHARALRVACSYLGPLAASHPTLLKPLKETLLALLRPNGDAIAKDVPLSVLATSLQVAMGRRLGIEEPQLMKIMKATLHTHSEWFRLQMCNDRFEGLLKIDYLKEIDAPLLIDSTTKTNVDTCTHSSSQVTISSSSRMPEDGSSPSQVSSRDVVCEEAAILKVMEFLALPRADAIHLLTQYNGNAETVIQQIFA
ncbi:ran-binding protein in the microtubule-organising centre protein [Tasmannia lanceolata]|uniref:ran-binding protein in the microtubule-organising centre protein n=1 Tax=Tasmannia lanceolata TaxID=3420 RepID=UPI0040633311